MDSKIQSFIAAFFISLVLLGAIGGAVYHSSQSRQTNQERFNTCVSAGGAFVYNNCIYSKVVPN